MKVGIISFAHGHANGYANALKQIDGVELYGIADEEEERGRQAADRFGSIYFADYQDLLKEPIDAVVVTSENQKHLEHVKAAAEHGKHILCEKPLSSNVQDAEEMIRVCKEKGVILQTAFPVRFNTPIQHAKKVIDSGELGNIVAIKGTNRGTNPGGWFVQKEKSGGGAVIDHTVHVVDIIRWFTKAEIVEVYAEIDDKLSDYEIDDTGLLTMEFDNGMFATLDCSWSRNKSFPTWGDVTLEIVGTNGTLSVDAFAQKMDVYHEDGVNWSFWGDNMDQGLVEDFVQTVRVKGRPSISGEDGLKALEAAMAAYQSSERKEAVAIKDL
ncbi:Gfo/Idh/MocA family protein [Gracilibacillus alcaliphilus]|uniref:Gfo/Idh/MocA family protein n=1 Tax=Gracilibacillus alcaliphilus TaxID=1401441 RepID=UPI001956B934|nr:Gfo/Idh/MocA family oxidoreductase [Gracilibacillus alcaliphilus]MBM7677468.1 putative dehydrogenase [Gracilibacillus alcaliphilus]